MKLRIRGSAIRLRLTKPEVDALRSNGSVEEATLFPDGAMLRYALVIGPKGGSALTAAFGKDGILITVPEDRAAAWCDSDEVGIAGEDGPTKILVEKDWACVQPRSDEEPSEMFDRPR